MIKLQSKDANHYMRTRSTTNQNETKTKAKKDRRTEQNDNKDIAREVEPESNRDEVEMQ